VPRRGFLAAFAAAAKLVETECSKRTYERKAGGQRKEQRQYRMAEDKSEQDKTENGIDHAQNNGVGRYGVPCEWNAYRYFGGERELESRSLLRPELARRHH
jgi:hypothetical protein